MKVFGFPFNKKKIELYIYNDVFNEGNLRNFNMECY